jgi:hypothetical protein
MQRDSPEFRAGLNSSESRYDELMTTIEWFVSVGAGLIAPFALVALIGCLLPRTHSLTRSINLKQNAHAVWASITAFERIPGWWPPCVMVERLPDTDGHATYRETFLLAGRRQPIDLEVLESVADSRLVTRIVKAGGPFRGRWVYELAPVSAGCKLTLTSSSGIGNPFVRAMSRIAVNRARVVESYLVCLGAKFGERVTLS